MKRFFDVTDVEKVVENGRTRVWLDVLPSFFSFRSSSGCFFDADQTVEKREHVQRRGNVVHTEKPKFLEQNAGKCRAHGPRRSEKDVHEADSNRSIFDLKIIKK